MEEEKGFTMVEILVVLGIVMLISFVGIVGSVSKVNQTRTEEGVSGLSSLIYQCQQNAYGGKDGRACGIRFSSGYYEVYSGDDYAHAVTKDRIDFPAGVQITEANFGLGGDVKFSIGSFRPVTAGFVNVSDGRHSYQIVVNKEGLIYCQ